MRTPNVSFIPHVAIRAPRIDRIQRKHFLHSGRICGTLSLPASCTASGNSLTEIFRFLCTMRSQSSCFPDRTGFSPVTRRRLRVSRSPRSAPSFSDSCRPPDFMPFTPIYYREQMRLSDTYSGSSIHTIGGLIQARED